jgi:hypothetical protein
MTKSFQAAVAKKPVDDRAAKARWLKGRLDELDRCIRAGSITSHEACIVENLIHRTAQRMGL